MKYYPLFLNMKGKKCLVVGGGPVGARKAATLEKCGAEVRVVSDRFSDAFNHLKTGSICLEKKKYDENDVKGMFLVFAATNQTALNKQIKTDAATHNILCNVADAPDNSDFVLPSIVEQGDLIVAVSTSGTSPAVAKTIRKELEVLFGPEYARLLRMMGQIRKKLLSSGHAPNDHKNVLNALIEKGILERIKADDATQINAVLHDVLGKEYTYQDLVFSRSDE